MPWLLQCLKFFLVIMHVKLPLAVHFQYCFDHLSCASLASRASGDVISSCLYLIYRIAWADSASACENYRDIRQVVSEVHHFFSFQIVFAAEVIEVFDLCTRTEVDVVCRHSTCAEAQLDALCVC